jgi:hypothetical protein
MWLAAYDVHEQDLLMALVKMDLMAENRNCPTAHLSVMGQYFDACPADSVVK